MAIVTLGIDLAKNVFALHGVDATGRAVLVRPSVARSKLLELVASLPQGTHNQALSALLFLYRHVLGVTLPWLTDLERPTRPKRIPSVLTQGEVGALLGALDGEMALLGKLLYGTGMRLAEGLALRVKDVDFARNAVVVRQGKGGKDRVVMLPRSLAGLLKQQIATARVYWEQDRQRGGTPVAVPDALAVKYPDLGCRWAWQELLGHSDVSTTMIYTHVLKVAAGGAVSPLDVLADRTRE